MPAGGLTVDITIIPSPTIIVSAFGQLADLVGRFKEPFREAIVDVMAPSIGTNFDVGGRPSWQPLSEATLPKKTQYGGGGVLVLSGALSQTAGQLDEWDIGEDSATMGLSDSVWYGRVHEEGTDKIPQREWALFQAEDVDKIEQIFGDWMSEQVEKALWL